MHACRSVMRGLGWYLVLLALAAPISVRAQAASQRDLEPLTTPRDGVGHCRPLSLARLSPQDSARGLRDLVEITLEIGDTLTGARQITVWADSAGNVLHYKEIVDAKDKRGRWSMHGILAGLAPTGQVAGFHRQFDIEALAHSPRPSVPTDSAPLRALSARLFPPLDSTEKQRVRAMADWIRRRCGARSTSREEVPKAGSPLSRG